MIFVYVSISVGFVSNFDFTCQEEKKMTNEWFWMILEVDVSRNYHLFRKQQPTTSMSQKTSEYRK